MNREEVIKDIIDGLADIPQCNAVWMEYTNAYGWEGKGWEQITDEQLVDCLEWMKRVKENPLIQLDERKGVR